MFYPGELTGSCTVSGLLAGSAAIEQYVPLVGSVFQIPKTQYFNVDTTAELAFPCENSGMPPTAIRQRVQEVVAQFHLEALMDRSVFKISGGEKQRAAVARALITRPQILLADEPTGALDSRSTDELLKLFGEINASGQTIVMVTHSVRAASCASRVLFLRDGEVSLELKRGKDTDSQFYQRITDALTQQQTGGECA